MSSYLPLDQETIKKVLEGTKSGMDDIVRRNEESREDILREMCPHCNSPLVPRLNPDVTKIFVGTRISYVGWCPRCASAIKE